MNPLHPLFATILKPIAPPGRWDDPRPEREPFKDDATAHFTRNDPGASLPGECVHDWFFHSDGSYHCHWCHLKIEDAP